MFIKDSRTENVLSNWGIPFKYSNNVKFSDLIPGWNDRNQGRKEPRVEDVILEYATRMDNGSPAPASILRKTPAGLDPLDGIQRLCAEELRGTTLFSAYIVTVDSDQVALKFRIMANHLFAGHPESAEWTKKRAVQMLIVEREMSVEEVARLGGWKQADIEEELKINIWGFAIRCNGGPEQLPKGVLLAVDEYAKMDDLQLAKEPVIGFVSDLKRAKFTNGESKPFIENFFNVNRTDNKRVYKQFEKHLNEFRDDPEVQARLEGRKASCLTPEIELRKTLRNTLTVCKRLLRDKHKIPYMEEYYQLWNQVKGVLTSIESNKTLVNKQ